MTRTFTLEAIHDLCLVLYMRPGSCLVRMNRDSLYHWNCLQLCKLDCVCTWTVNNFFFDELKSTLVISVTALVNLTVIFLGNCAVLDELTCAHTIKVTPLYEMNSACAGNYFDWENIAVWLKRSMPCCCRPSLIAVESLGTAGAAINELLKKRPIKRPTTEEAIKLAPEAVKRLAFIVQSFHTRLQRYVRERGITSLGSFVELCPKRK